MTYQMFVRETTRNARCRRGGWRSTNVRFVVQNLSV